jgi:hypothetical protein
MTTPNSAATRPASSGAAIAVAATAIIFAWCWFAVMLGETYDEYCKAGAGGASEIRFLMVVGVAPLVAVSAGALVALVLTARGTTKRRLASGTGIFLASSVAGVLFAWAFSGWTLFAHFAIGSNCSI